MKMSLRTKLFLGMSCLIVFFVASSWLLNSQFLGRYYILQKRASLIESKQMIEQIYKGNPEELSTRLENLERNGSMNVYLLSSDYEMKYSSRMYEPGFPRMRPDRPDRPPLIHSILPKLENLPQGNYLINVTLDPRLKTNFLTLTSKLKNGDILILSSPIATINESTSIANRFFLFTGLLTIVLGGIAVYFFAKRFTKPILELNNIAQRMSKLDFSKKYPIQSNDEVGQLGNSLNSLSNQLDKSISELKAANEKLREDIERERQIDKMRKEFVSNVSHELKTPIALIQGYAEGLKLNINEDEENKDFYCNVIMDEADKMNKLVKDLLDLSQIESGYFKLERTVFDISTMVDYVLDKYRPILTEKQIIVRVDKQESTSVSGDLVRIEQVLVNYLNNAINHVNEHKKIDITVTTQNDKVRVAVYNSGNPIPKKSLDKIWTSFYKVDKARTREYGGTGLGLSVVRAILELHHNAFGVENRADGVLFWFEVDKADEL